MKRRSGASSANFETIDVFFSWDTTAARVDRKVANFHALWRGETTNLTVMELPEAVQQELITISERHAPKVLAANKPLRKIGPMRPPEALSLRDYQQSAIDALTLAR